eukprot:1340265-Amphidinium_carterae.2
MVFLYLFGNIPYRDSEKLHSIFSLWGLLTQAVEQYQGCLALEWPDTCKAWKTPFVKVHLKDYGYESALVKSCRFGGKTVDGYPNTHMWRVATNCKQLLHSMSHASTCTHSEHRDDERHPYSAYFAIAIHQAVRSWVRSKIMGCTVCHRKGIPSLVQDVLDNIPPMTIPLSTARTNVYDAKEGRVRGFLFGASPGRGPQVAKAGFEHKSLLVVLHALATTSPIHTYSTIQFNHLQVETICHFTLMEEIVVDHSPCPLETLRVES